MEQAGFNNNDVIAACTILAKKDQDNNELKKAEKYLIAFQKSPQSWTISCEILAMENMHVDVLAQVAIFLKQKFQYDFFQLPQDEYVNLAKLLIRFMLNHFHSSITSQLSLGLVLLYMHTFESLGDLIDILGQTLFTAEKKEGLALDVIKLMPEVSYDNKVIVNNKQRDQYTKFLLNKEAPKVFEILENLGKNENLGGTLKYKILDVFQEWFYFARKNQGVIDNIHDHSCFALALNSMSDSLLAEKARSSINTIIKAVRRPEEHPKIFEAIFKYIFEYMKDCNEVLKTDVDHALEYTKVFRSFGIKFSRTMIESPNEGLMKILQYIIELTANQKLYTDVLIELEEFWEEFSNDFARVIKNNQYPGKIEEFAEVFKLLIQITVTRIQMNEEQLLYIENKAERRKYYEDDNDDDDNEDDAVDQDLREIEDKQDERRLCRNILLDVQDIIGFSNTFSTIFDTLRELIAKVQENNINWDNLGWDLIAKFECIMYTAKSCIISNKTKELPDLTEFFQLVMPIKLKSVKANRTKIELIEYAAEKAIMSEEIMSSMFTYLAENLKDPRTAADAGIALIDLCENCSGFVIKNFESFLELRQQFENNDDLVIGLAVAIAHDRQTQARERYLALLCTPFAERIVKYMDMWDNDQSEDLAIDIKSNLKKLTMIFGKMPILEEGQTENSNHPLEPVLVELWPIFKNAFKKFYTHTRILVNLCNVIKKCLRTLTIKFKPFLLEYLELVCEIFPLHPLADFLYAIEVSASIFGKDEEMIPTLTKVYEYVSSATLNFINDKDMRDHDELLEDFFGMLFRYIKYLPQVVLYSNTLEINLHLAELAIGVDQPNIEKTLFLFLEVLFQMCSYNPKDDIEKAMTEIIVNKYGAIYTKKLIKEFTFYPQERLRKYIRDIIFGSFVHLKEHTLQWLEMCLSADVSDNILTPAEKEDMLRSLQKIDVNKPKRRSDDTESDSEEESTWSVREDFKELFEFFEYRCKLVDRRNYKLEKA